LKLERYGNGIAKGMLVTIKHLFRHPVTTQYPEQKLTVSRRTRGNELIWQESTCIACGLCAQNCPQGVIHMQVENKKVTSMTADMGYCIFCGLCVEACPRDSLFLSYEYEKSCYKREDLNLDKEKMLFAEGSPKKRSGFARPKVEAELPKQTLLQDRNKLKK
jgi:NAD(P)H-quinone oxidoreductase subunit I